MLRTRQMLTIAFAFCLGTFFLCNAQAGWSGEWERTLSEARKEGQVNVYLSSAKASLNAFKREYPDIKVVTVTGRPAGVIARIMAERRAGKYIPDLIIMGPTAIVLLHKRNTLTPIKPALILPEVLDTSKWFGGKHGYIDHEGKYIFLYMGRPSGVYAYNVNLVDPKEFSSYWDVLKPKWKGKIVSLDPRETGIGQPLTFFYHTPTLGRKYIRKLYTEMEVTLSKSTRQMIDWLGHGKFSFCMGCKRIQSAIDQGLPLKNFPSNQWKEGTYFAAGGDSIGMFNRHPHPNAAKVFVNWYLSRKGQIAMQKLDSRGTPKNSRRIDVPKDYIAPEYQLIEGRKYFEVDQPKYSDPTYLIEFAKEIIGTGMQKR